MSDNIEYFKASLPIAALIGVVVGAFLNSRLQRKDKLQEHLFTYKVKSYMEIARIITETIRRMEKIRSSYYSRKDGESFYEVYNNLVDTISEQSLFISSRTKSDLDELLKSLHKVYDSELFREDYDVRIVHYISSIYECRQFLQKLQNDIGYEKKPLITRKIK
ncbi:hypothetical protein AB670_00028 [Chryseobacterium sp. MOF25P]|uniref:hypothetical protein n=1 Tax=unclassified Chryseobacterium TaxID=2593645 RepID=UPI000805A762|nr:MULTISPECIES: hypothetical protein [unclassified Chryseobacterium]OBW43499.1 hypothetical protein AB670_00028 [Chryseobacterium sp. MOF25P]OBW46727.1 hypothetical protein AB671_01223 [Chryseobacterium sp. BGARF1]